MENYLSLLLDDRNRQLWENINSKFDVQLEKSPEPNYRTRVNNNIAIIGIDTNNINPSSFTHELLHVLLKDKKLNIVEDFYNAIRNSENANGVFSTVLKEHVTNCLEHVIILPIFLNMGFRNEEFIKDYSEKKMNNRLMTTLQEKFKIGNSYNLIAVDFYIGKFFAMKSCNNSSFNYTKYYEKFKKLDPQLFQLLDDFWNDWQTFEIDNPNDSYDEILELFLTDLTKWLRNKNMA